MHVGENQLFKQLLIYFCDISYIYHWISETLMSIYTEVLANILYLLQEMVDYEQYYNTSHVLFLTRVSIL